MMGHLIQKAVNSFWCPGVKTKKIWLFCMKTQKELRQSANGLGKRNRVSEAEILEVKKKKENENK